MTEQENRNGNAAWLAELAMQVHRAALRLKGRADPDARAELESLAATLGRFCRTTASAARAAEPAPLPLFAGAHATTAAPVNAGGNGV